MAQLDHIMYAVPDLNDGIAEVQKLTAVKAEFGGVHPGNGTCNALLSLEENQYLEIIAPDVNQDLKNTLGAELQAHNFSGIRTWAVSVSGFESLSEVLTQFGYHGEVISMSRNRPDGVRLDWQILYVRGHPYANFMPFFIDWLDSPHPARVAPSGCKLDSFAVQLVEGSSAYGSFLSALEIEVEVMEGPDGMRAVIDSPNGRVMLH